jgi:hypothetical protein
MKYWLILIMSGLLCACGGSNTQTLPTDPDPNITVVPYQNLFVPPPPQKYSIMPTVNA